MAGFPNTTTLTQKLISAKMNSTATLAATTPGVSPNHGTANVAANKIQLAINSNNPRRRRILPNASAHSQGVNRTTPPSKLVPYESFFKVMVCQLVYSISPCREFSQPSPDCLWPPKAWKGENW